MRQQGRLTEWNDPKGFGFITSSTGGARIFVHISSFPHGGRRPVVNEPVSYTLSRDGQKRLRAEQVRFQAPARAPALRARGLAPALAIAALFLALLAGLVVRGQAPLGVPAFYLLMSAVSLVLYGIDKSAAANGRWRTKEATLHLFELAGGWPGALVAQRLFRHKTRKQPFQFIFWCAVIVNCAALGWILFAEAASQFRRGLGIG